MITLCQFSATRLRVFEEDKCSFASLNPSRWAMRSMRPVSSTNLDLLLYSPSYPISVAPCVSLCNAQRYHLSVCCSGFYKNVCPYNRFPNCCVLFQVCLICTRRQIALLLFFYLYTSYLAAPVCDTTACPRRLWWLLLEQATSQQRPDVIKRDQAAIRHRWRPDKEDRTSVHSCVTSPYRMYVSFIFSHIFTLLPWTTSVDNVVYHSCDYFSENEYCITPT